MAASLEACEPLSVTFFKDRYARYRAKHKEKRAAYQVKWWAENGAAYKQANLDKVQAYAASYRERNREKCRAAGRKFRADKPDRQRAFERKYRAEHPERIKASGSAYALKEGVKESLRKKEKDWRSRNLARLAAKAAARRAARLQATPAWADHTVIAAIYAECARITAETGIVHHVDHIVPLKGKIVCGLHVENNLQILVGTENLSKGNRL